MQNKQEQDLIFFTQKIPNVKLDNFAALLRRSGIVVSFFAQLIGYCPSSLNANNKLVFRWLSWPVFLIGVQTTEIILALLCYHQLDETHPDKKEVNRVDRFGSSLIIVSSIQSASYLRLMGIIFNRKTRELWSKLGSKLTDIYQLGTEASKMIFQEELKRYIRITNVVYLVIYIGGIGLIISRVVGLFATKMVVECGITAGLLGMIVLNLNLVFSVTYGLWFVHIISLIRIGFTVLRHEKSRSRSLKVGTPQSKSGQMYHRFRHFAGLEELVRILNEDFSLELTLTFILVGILLTNIFYDVFRIIHDAEYFRLLEMIPFLITNVTTLCLLCHSGTLMTRQARRTAIWLISNQNQDFSCDHEVKCLGI